MSPSFPLKRNSYAEVLTPSVAIFGDGVFKEIIKLKCGHRVRLVPWDWCPYRRVRHWRKGHVRAQQVGQRSKVRKEQGSKHH